MSNIEDEKQRLLELLNFNDIIYKNVNEENDINATAIVAIGDQSHGKSSVLESLSKVELPKGNDIKTRMPLGMKKFNIQ